MKVVIALLLLLVAGQTPPTLDQDRESLTKGTWGQGSKSKDGRILSELNLGFGKDKVQVVAATVTVTGKARSMATHVSEYEYRLAEQDGKRVLLIKAKKTEKDVVVPYKFDGAKLIIEGPAADDLGFTGEWTRNKEREKAKEKDNDKK